MIVEIQKGDTNQTEGSNKNETNTSITPTKNKTKVKSFEGIISLDASDHKIALGLYTHYDALSMKKKYKFGFNVE